MSILDEDVGSTILVINLFGNQEISVNDNVWCAHIEALIYEEKLKNTLIEMWKIRKIQGIPFWNQTY